MPLFARFSRSFFPLLSQGGGRRQRQFFAITAILVMVCTPFGVYAQNRGSYSSGYDTDNTYTASRSGVSGGSAALATLEARLSTIEDQMRTLTGQVERTDHATTQLETTLQRLQADIDSRLNTLERAPAARAEASPTAPPVAADPAAVPPAGGRGGDFDDEPIQLDPRQSNEPAVEGRLGALTVQDGAVTGAIQDPRAPKLPAVPDDYGLSASEQYDRAFDLLRRAKYDQAEDAFKAFLDKNPKDKLADNSRYWYAETFYVRGKFEQAAVAFADAYKTNPKSAKAPDSLLKLAMSLSALKKTDDACATLAALTTNFPRASAAVRARSEQEKTRLRCTS